METIKGGRMELYRINYDSYILQTMGQPVMDEIMRWIDMGVLVKVEPIPASVCDDPWNCCIHDPSDWGY